MCNRETSTVLATLNTTDFLYTCDTHLTDRGFASPLDPPAEASSPKPTVSQAEIDKAKKEWEEKQERKKAKEKEKEREKSDDKKDDKDKEKSVVKDKPTSPPPVSPPPTPPARSHQRYSLHRDVFAMRLAEQKKRRQTKAVKEVAPRLPGAPRSSLSPVQ